MFIMRSEVKYRMKALLEVVELKVMDVITTSQGEKGELEEEEV